MSSFVFRETEPEAAINNLVEALNDCLIKWYDKWPEKDRIDFTPCCDEKEMNILLTSYNIYREHDKNTHFMTIIKAIIIYYYSVTVIEYYALFGNECIKFFYKNYFPGEQNNKMLEIIIELSFSNEIHATKIRRLMLGFDGGNKKNTFKKRKTYKKKKYSKSKN